MFDHSHFSDLYLILVAAAAIGVAIAAVAMRDGSLGLAAGILVVYVLHLGSLRSVERGHRKRRGTLRQVERMVEDVRGLDASRARPRHTDERHGPAASSPLERPDDLMEEGYDPGDAVEPGSEARVRRQFAFGTVALIRDLLTPEEVSHVLLEQERQPNRRFGEIAMRYGFLSEEQVRELLTIQQEGLFAPEAIRSARQRVEAYRKNQVANLSGSGEL